jgi:DNA polymerase-3 subunit epsilon
MGRCLSPCDQSVSQETYAATVAELRASLVATPVVVLERLTRRMDGYAKTERYEEATRFRDRLAAYLRGTARTQRLRALTRCPELVAARKEDAGWVVHVVRHGRLAAAGVIPAGADASLWVLELRAGAEAVLPGPGPLPASPVEEVEVVLRWLEADGVRLVHVEGEWSCPAGGAGGHLTRFDAVETSRRELARFDP